MVIMNEEVKKPILPLLKLMEESMNLMKAYIGNDKDCGIIYNGQPNYRYFRSLSYSDVLLTIYGTDNYLIDMNNEDYNTINYID